MVDMLPSIAHVVDYLRKHGDGSVSLLENLCIPAEGVALTLSPWDHRLRFCLARGPSTVIMALFSMLGLSDKQAAHYPWGRHVAGPSVFAHKATFDCSDAYYGDFWHVAIRHAARSANKARPSLTAQIHNPMAPIVARAGTLFAAQITVGHAAAAALTGAEPAYHQPQRLPEGAGR